MNMLKRLPYFVEIQGQKYKINVDFALIISLEKVLQDKSLDDKKKLEKVIRSFYPAFSKKEDYFNLLCNPKIYKKACEKFIWFYKCGREDYHRKTSGKGGNNNRAFDYDYDDEYIWGALKQCYNVDLTEESIHWWKFRAMIKSLPSECEFVKIQGYRTYTGDDKQMKELKKYWELPLPIEEQERLKALYEVLK